MLTSQLLALAALLPASLACVPAPPTNGNGTSGDFIIGPDDPSDPETVGYFLNHISLSTNNLTRSLDFYTEVFGMRHMFTSYLTEHISFSYMGHSNGGRNGTAYQTTEELIRYKNNAQGMLELVNLNIPRDEIPGPARTMTTLNHIGIIVPDPAKTQERLDRYGVQIYKRVGEPMPTEGVLVNKEIQLGDVSNLSDEEWTSFLETMGQLNMGNIFAADPDGNLLEILPMDEGDLFG